MLNGGIDLANIVEVTEQNFAEEVLAGDLPVFVDFWAVWCGPCRMIAPVFEELSQEYAGKIKFVKVNVDEVTEPVGTYGIMSIPTLLIFENGEVVNKMMGFRPKKDLLAEIGL